MKHVTEENKIIVWIIVISVLAQIIVIQIFSIIEQPYLSSYRLEAELCVIQTTERRSALPNFLSAVIVHGGWQIKFRSVFHSVTSWGTTDSNKWFWKHYLKAEKTSGLKRVGYVLKCYREQKTLREANYELQIPMPWTMDKGYEWCLSSVLRLDFLLFVFSEKVLAISNSFFRVAAWIRIHIMLLTVQWWLRHWEM